MLRDCRLDLPEYFRSAHFFNYLQLGLAVTVAAINLAISAFDPTRGAFKASLGGVLDNIG